MPLSAKFIKISVVVCLTLIGAASCGAPHQQTIPVQSVAAEDTTVGAGDVFDVRVYGEKELCSTYRVASDGSIDFPLIGTIVVDGLTPSQVKDKIEQLLRDGEFLKAPQVSILVKEYNSKTVSVFGQVNKPGTFPYIDGMGVVQAISAAGGFTPMARADDTTVTRVVDGRKQNFVVQVRAIGEGKESDFVLRSGDIVFVPERVF